MRPTLEYRPFSTGRIRMFLVMGVTGKVGGATARHLLAHGKRVRALVRSREKAADWMDQGVELVDGDWNDTAAIERALDGVDGAFVMLPAGSSRTSFTACTSPRAARSPFTTIRPAGNRRWSRRTTSVPRWRRC